MDRLTLDPDQPAEREIAIVGMAGRFPGAADLDAFWQNLKDGREAVTCFDDEELAAAGVRPEVLRDPSYVKAGAILGDVERFDAAFFGYTPREAELLDPQQRLFLEHAWAALEHAGCIPGSFDGAIGIYAGVAWNTYLLSNLASHRQLFDEASAFNTFISSDKDFMPTRVSYKLNLKGPSMTIQTSCSTSLVAVHMACLSLLDYECDVALAGGVTVRVPQRQGYLYQEGGLASPDGHCRAFDARAQGTIFGSGVGVVALKRLADALADGDYIHAVIKGSAINNDGSLKVSYTAPSVDGQAEVISAAQAVARVSPDTIGYVEAHGTGTALGDPVEVAALTKAFRLGTDKAGFCALGSVKSNVGHLDAAAGVAGLIKTVLALKHRQLPPSLNYEQPNPAIDFASSPFYVNTKLANWAAADHPRRAGVSSFGVGGTNAHVILEEAPAPPPATPAEGWQLLVLSAKSAPALEGATQQLAAYLRDHPEASLADVAYTLQARRARFRHRRALVCANRAAAVRALEDAQTPGMLSYDDPQDHAERQVIFMFPGQGAQHPGMGRELYATEPVFRTWLDRCADMLRWHIDLDLRTLLYPPEQEQATAAERLRNTALAQPALFAVEYALAQLWLARGLQPAAMIGHSLGEYVAACLAGVFTLEEALALVAARGRMMQELPSGVMLAVPLDERAVAPLLSERVCLAAVNDAARCVLSGPEEAIAEVERWLAEQGLEGRRLHTSHAFHSAMMEPLLAGFAAQVRRVRLRPPRLPYLSNVSGTWVTPEEATSPEYWARHLRQTVRFAAGITALLQDADLVLLEVGPGQTLSALARQHERRPTAIPSLGHPHDQQPDPAQLLTALARLWLAGVRLDWHSLHGDARPRHIPLPTYAFDRQRYWIAPRAGEAEPAPGPAGKRVDPARWFYLPAWRQTLTPRAQAEAGDAGVKQRWLIFSDRQGLGAAIGAALLERGHSVTTVDAADTFGKDDAARYTLNPRQPADYGALVAALQASEGVPERVVHLWSATPTRALDGESAFEEQQHAGLYSLLWLVQALDQHEHTAPLQLDVVSCGMQQIGNEPAPEPGKATLLGLCKTLPQEQPRLRCRSVDILLGQPAPSIARVAQQLLGELLSTAEEPVVAYRGGRRWRQTYEPLPLERPAADDVALRPGGVYLVTGALDGLGLELARALARATPCRLVLLDALPIPPRETWPEWLEREGEATASGRALRRIQELEALGAEVLVARSDLQDEAELRGALTLALERYGALHGVIHAGGAAERSFRSILETDAATCEAHVAHNVHAVRLLERVLGDLPLDFCLLCSSLASVLGGRGATAYAASTLYLDAFTRWHNDGANQRWVSVNWDAWRLPQEEQGGAALSASLAELALDPTELAEVLLRALGAQGTDQLVVSTGDLDARIAQWLAPMPTALHGDAREARTRHPRPTLQTLYAAPESERERELTAIWEHVLGVAPIGLDDNFFELGGDSLSAIQVIAQIKKQLQVAIPATRLYQGLTVRALAPLLEQDEEQLAQRRSAQLSERRGQMDRRRQFLETRRAARPE